MPTSHGVASDWHVPENQRSSPQQLTNRRSVRAPKRKQVTGAISSDRRRKLNRTQAPIRRRRTKQRRRSAFHFGREDQLGVQIRKASLTSRKREEGGLCPEREGAPGAVHSC